MQRSKSTYYYLFRRISNIKWTPAQSWKPKFHNNSFRYLRHDESSHILSTLQSYLQCAVVYTKNWETIWVIYLQKTGDCKRYRPRWKAAQFPYIVISCRLRHRQRVKPRSTRLTFNHIKVSLVISVKQLWGFLLTFWDF